jgi:uncharacterized protein (DUF488 family)
MQRKNDLPAGQLFSLGHSSHDLGEFVALLRHAGITRVADVRSRPYSVRSPHFNRPELREALAEAGIAYTFLGDQLGGRPEDAEVYDEAGRVDYEKVQRTPTFREGLERLLALLVGDRVAMLCAEEDPLDCHRGLLIAPALAAAGVGVAHLRGDGSVESARDFEQRLLEATGLELGPTELFGEPTGEEYAEFLARAYREQGRRRAFRLRPEQEEAG